MKAEPRPRFSIRSWMPAAFFIAFLILILIKFDALAFFFARLVYLMRPLWLAVVLFYFFDRPVSFFREKLWQFPFFKQRNRALIVSITLVYLIFLGLITLLFFLILPSFQSSLTEFFSNFQYYIFSFNRWADKWAEYFNSKNVDPVVISQLQSKVQDIGTSVTLRGLDFARSLISSIIAMLGNLAIGLILAVYLLLDEKRIRHNLKRIVKALSPKRSENWIHVFSLMDRTFSAYFYVQLTEALLLGIMCFLIMSIFSIPYLLIVCVLITVCAMVPVVGAWVSAGIGGFLILLVDPEKCLIYLIILIVTQQIEGNVIYPRRLNTRVGLPALLVILTVITGYGIGGVYAAIVAVPLASTLYQLGKEWVLSREEKKHRDAEATLPITKEGRTADKNPEIPLQENAEKVTNIDKI